MPYFPDVEIPRERVIGRTLSDLMRAGERFTGPLTSYAQGYGPEFVNLSDLADIPQSKWQAGLTLAGMLPVGKAVRALKGGSWYSPSGRRTDLGDFDLHMHYDLDAGDIVKSAGKYKSEAQWTNQRLPELLAAGAIRERPGSISFDPSVVRSEGLMDALYRASEGMKKPVFVHYPRYESGRFAGFDVRDVDPSELITLIDSPAKFLRKK
jgi:hypothetical protein